MYMYDCHVKVHSYFLIVPCNNVLGDASTCIHVCRSVSLIDFIDIDCVTPKKVVPQIIQILNPVCDIRREKCDAVSILSTGVVSGPTLTCKIVVTRVSKITFASGQLWYEEITDRAV